MTPRRGIVLFAHGSRDPQWARPMDGLARALRARDPGTPVEIAFLELMPPTLPEAIAVLAGQEVAEIAVLPVFWAAGAHVTRDLARLLDEARAAHPAVRFASLPVLSELPGVLDAVAEAALRPAAAPDVPE
ncbi:CbiX/SirB N-terminal domain-containing protein [Pigmentiphaga sp.]|uniref:sirohydrochlorin chelatase n=1 Tax=Pigmentiphaga sp. TaxID=1977564 RepID=UPI00128D0902|nr:CbiX/SirB N-terminal domain-containing protein [Pigmentiphaga sp.]MPS27962.1 cobalamin biosynthesis protein CbiX [Alcaligenaceae bacterium SAGV5]MPS51072.1 cobalamin biosynthesis protein CbiX [Alcaligenaceae bacterium SAGV3]MPT59410.1 cobalamin biosynthesis protein CbiX [Alcaligenaceae bacterium]